MRETVAIADRGIMARDQAAAMLTNLAHSMRLQDHVFGTQLDKIDPAFRVSARNLLHYLVLRSIEIRPLQEYLHACGLSSLTSSESHTLSQLLQVMRWLDIKTEVPELEKETFAYEKALRLRKEHLDVLLGTNPNRNIPHIMVTLSQELAADKRRLEELLAAGMTVVRINCGHDNPDIWFKMINSIRQVSEFVDRPCKVYMDLSGPRIRISQVPVRPKTNTEGLVLQEGEIIELSERHDDIRKGQRKRNGCIKVPARIVMQPQGIIGMIKPGERIFFDDGKFEAKVIDVKKHRVSVIITRISTRKPVLRAGKGVNLPDSALTISSLTNEDLDALPFIAAHADLIGYSFVSGPEDVRLLRQKLAECNGHVPSIILKIERLAAVQNLPALLFEGMKDPSFGVMIARGDLAVEIGFERLSEIQQEILWICEAAHVPVIWATQVLENMNKTGFATRSEITDAAMGSMAECVMLNKGRHVVKTVYTLVDILSRFTSHADKKRYTFRPLSIACNFLKYCAIANQ